MSTVKNSYQKVVSLVGYSPNQSTHYLARLKNPETEAQRELLNSIEFLDFFKECPPELWKEMMTLSMMNQNEVATLQACEFYDELSNKSSSKLVIVTPSPYELLLYFSRTLTGRWKPFYVREGRKFNIDICFEFGEFTNKKNFSDVFFGQDPVTDYRIMCYTKCLRNMIKNSQKLFSVPVTYIKGEYKHQKMVRELRKLAGLD